MARRLDGGPGSAKNGVPAAPGVIVLVERPDPAGERWARAIELLLEAGRQRQEADGP